MTLTKYATLSFITLVLLLVFGINSGAFAQSSKNSDSPTVKTGKNNNGISSLKKSARKNINTKTQGKESAGHPDDGFATDSDNNNRFDSGIVRARIVPVSHSQEKIQIIKTNSRNSANLRAISSGLRTRLVNGGSINKAAKDLGTNRVEEAKRIEKEVKLRTNTRQKAS